MTIEHALGSNWRKMNLKDVILGPKSDSNCGAGTVILGVAVKAGSTKGKHDLAMMWEII